MLKKKKAENKQLPAWLLCEEEQLLFTAQWSLAVWENEEAQVPVNRPDFDQWASG